MDRRTFLRAAGAVGTGLAGLAGCSSPQNGGDAGADGDEPGIGTATETGTGTETQSGTARTGTGAGTDGGGGGASAYEFLGRVQGWLGQAPSGIEGQENPSLQLRAGQEYEVTWTNDDGVPHDFTIQDADGNNLQQTELLSEQGASATLTFTASEEMAQYICTVHPNTMVGTLEVSA